MEGAVTSGGRSGKFWVILILAVIGLVFAAVNFQKVEIDFIVGSAHAPLVVALLIAGGLGFVIGLALPRLRGRS
jgi:uncharacterized integral membrane protein